MTAAFNLAQLANNLNTSGQLDATDGLFGVLPIANGGTGTTTGAVPPGSIVYYSLNTAPTGYLKANGAAVSRTTYANLFAIIGTNFGNGDGSTTFNLPDLRGSFLRAWDDGKGLDPGRAFASYQADEFASHTHNLDGSLEGYAGGGGTQYFIWRSPGGGGVTRVTIPNGAFATGGVETRPKNIALLACIKY